MPNDIEAIAEAPAPAHERNFSCMACGSENFDTFVDLGVQPLANELLDNADAEQSVYPLHVVFCRKCLLVQIANPLPRAQIFTDRYPYFSSINKPFVAQARVFAHGAITRLGLNAGPSRLVVEIGSNDGYLLRHFVEAGISALGIEPCRNVAEVAERADVPTIVDFFSTAEAERLAAGNQRADLVIANNVLAHVPDLHDFIRGLAKLVKDDGVITIEFPWLHNLIRDCQFDTIYHEHYSYLSLQALVPVLTAHGLRIFAIEHLASHGGSLRLWVCWQSSHRHPTEDSAATYRAKEIVTGMDGPAGYAGFGACVAHVTDDMVKYLAAAKSSRRKVLAFGAAAKGNTLLNHIGATAADIAMVGDDTPAKQGKFLPGSRIPVVSRETLLATKPDCILILPWNWKDEIVASLRADGFRGGFVTALPRLEEIGHVD